MQSLHIYTTFSLSNDFQEKSLIYSTICARKSVCLPNHIYTTVACLKYKTAVLIQNYIEIFLYINIKDKRVHYCSFVQHIFVLYYII